MKESRPNGFCKDFTYKLFFIFYDIKSRNEQLLAHVTGSQINTVQQIWQKNENNTHETASTQSSKS